MWLYELYVIIWILIFIQNTYCILDLSTLLYVLIVCSFLLLSGSPLYDYTTVYLSIRKVENRREHFKVLVNSLRDTSVYKTRKGQRKKSELIKMKNKLKCKSQ